MTALWFENEKKKKLGPSKGKKLKSNIKKNPELNF